MNLIKTLLKIIGAFVLLAIINGTIYVALDKTVAMLIVTVDTLIFFVILVPLIIRKS